MDGINTELSKGSLDPLGKSFWNANDKKIHKEFRTSLGKHLDSPSVEILRREGLLVDFQKEEKSKTGMSRVIVDPVRFNTRGSEVITGTYRFTSGELPQHLRQKAARTWLAINNALLKDDLCLIDSHPGNFGIEGESKLVWLDLGSIQPVETGLEGVREFRSSYEFPLKIISKYPEMAGFIRSGLDRSQWLFRRTYSYFSKWPVVQYKNFGLVMGMITLASRNGYRLPSRRIRSIALKFLSLRLPRKIESRGYWARYSQRESYSEQTLTLREILVRDIVETLQGSSILDLAGSDGRFLWLVRKNNCTHLLVDTEDSGVSKFTRFISETQKTLPDGSSFTGLVRHFGSQDFRADIVLALAVTHHLSLSQGWDFKLISSHLSKVSKQHVVLDFMPKGVGKYQSQYSTMPDWYSLENFITALEREFSRVTIIEESKKLDRIIILCSK